MLTAVFGTPQHLFCVKCLKVCNFEHTDKKTLLWLIHATSKRKHDDAEAKPTGVTGVAMETDKCLVLITGYVISARLLPYSLAWGAENI